MSSQQRESTENKLYNRIKMGFIPVLSTVAIYYGKTLIGNLEEIKLLQQDMLTRITRLEVLITIDQDEINRLRGKTAYMFDSQPPQKTTTHVIIPNYVRKELMASLTAVELLLTQGEWQQAMGYVGEKTATLSQCRFPQKNDDQYIEMPELCAVMPNEMQVPAPDIEFEYKD